MGTLTETSRPEVVRFIGTATAEDLRIIEIGLNARKQDLKRQTVADLRPGAIVTLSGLSPKYLNGMTGEVLRYSRNRNRVEVRLDETSTRILATRSARFRVTPGETNYDLSGVPVACISRQD